MTITEVINSDEYAKFAEVAEEWTRIADAKWVQAPLEERPIFLESVMTNLWIANSLKEHRDCILHVCKNPAGEPEGLLLSTTSSRSFKIELLVTHPKNIRSSVNKLSSQVRGVGTRLIAAAEKTALQQKKKKLVLEPTSTSEGFYCKMGFLPDGYEMTKRLSFGQGA
jgi:hypothetical protein